MGEFDEDGFEQDKFYQVMLQSNGLYFAAFFFHAVMVTYYICGDHDKALEMCKITPIHMIEHLYGHADYLIWSSLTYAGMQYLHIRSLTHAFVKVLYHARVLKFKKNIWAESPLLWTKSTALKLFPQ